MRTLLERSIGQRLDEIAMAYRAHGLADALALFEAMRNGDRRFRVAVGGLEHLFPARRLAGELLQYASLIDEFGLGQGSRRALDSWSILPRVEAPGEAWRTLDREPFVAFGNHPVGVEAAIFSSLLRREDVFFLAGAHVAQVAPSLSRRVLAIQKTERSSLERDDGGIYEELTHGLTKKLWLVRGDFAASKENATVLSRAAGVVGKEGAGLHVFPTGSTEDKAWQRGVGRIVSEIVAAGSASTVYLVPVVYGIRATHVMASRLFPSGSVLRLIAQARVWLLIGPPWVYISRPVSIRQAGLEGVRSRRETTSALRELWMAAAREAKASMPRWTPFRRAQLDLSKRS